MAVTFFVALKTFLVKTIKAKLKSELRQAIAELVGPDMAKLVKQIKALSDGEIFELKKEFGAKIIDNIIGSANNEDKSDETEEQELEHKSSWVKSIRWSPILSTLHVTTQKGESFSLPFFPKPAVRRIIKGASPGKTIWSAYWRVYGKEQTLTKVFVKKSLNTAERRFTAKVNRTLPKIRVPSRNKQGHIVMKRVSPTFKSKSITVAGTRATKVKKIRAFKRGRI